MQSSEEFRQEALKYGMSTEDVQIGEDGLHNGHRARLAWHFWHAAKQSSGNGNANTTRPIRGITNARRQCYAYR